MSISKKEVEHIAELARIKLTETEKAKLAKELSAILGFVGQLNEVDTDAVLPEAGGTDLKNEMRPDAQIDRSLEQRQAEMLAAVPAKKGEWVKVKAVFE